MRKLVLFFVACFFISCNNKESNSGNDDIDNTPAGKDKAIDYAIFNVAKGYGYDIFKNGKMYIHQPFIPDLSGYQEFPTRESAMLLAKLIVSKLENSNYKFLLEKEEIDSFLSGQGFFKPSLSSVVSNIYADSEKGNTNGIVPAALQELYESPYKLKWTRKGQVPFGSRSEAKGFTIGDVIYIGGGQNLDEYSSEFWAYDTRQETWTCLASLPGKDKRVQNVSFSLGGKGYWGLGVHTGTGLKRFKKDFYEYDPSANRWARKNDFPGTARVDASCFTINNKAYVGLGYDESHTRDMYEYDPENDQWKRIADFAGGAASSALGVSSGNEGFVVAGDGPDGNQKFVYEYLPGKNSWLRRADMPGFPRYFLGGSFVDSGLFIAGCGGAKDTTNRLRDCYLFNAKENQWESLPDYPVPGSGISNLICQSANGKVFFGAGFDGSFRNDWNVFEYYFSIRPDTGLYDETVCYPLKFSGKWELYQECTSQDCYAGMEIKSSRSLGNFCYSSYLAGGERKAFLNENQSKYLFVFPRNFLVKTSVQPKQPVCLRLFFTKNEVETMMNECNRNGGEVFSFDDLRIMQTNEHNPDTNLHDNFFREGTFSFLKPQWYSYGFNKEILVAEFSVNKLYSEFYLVLPVK